MTQVIGKERHGRVRGLGLGPTPTSYYGYSTSRSTTSSSSLSTEFIDRFHQLEQELQQMEKDREQERAQFVIFLQNQFPGTNISIPDIGGPTSQPQNQSIGPEIPEGNVAGSSSQF